MFCCKCGTDLPDTTKFCGECGTATGHGWRPAGTLPVERLSRPRYDKKIAGVCAGFARYLNVDVTLVRVVWLILTFWPIPISGVLAYIIAWMVIPRDPLALPEPVQSRA